MVAPVKPNRYAKLDLDALHRVLWRMSDPKRHRLQPDQQKLAEELFVTKYTMSRCMAQLVADGRLRSLGRAGRQVLYVVARPADL